MARFRDWITPDGLARLEAWARDGLTEAQIAANIGVHYDTLHEWKKRFPEVYEAIKRGKEPADQKVENALYTRACGYMYEETRPDHGETVTITKHMPPDVAACIFWLRNRKPERWRNNPEAEQDTRRPSDLLRSLYDLMTKGDNYSGSVDNKDGGNV